jgi:hypothetical protein
MWEPEPPRASSGFQVYEVSFGDVDAGKRWIEAIDRSVRQARSVHKDQVLQSDDERDWDSFMSKWRPLIHDLQAIPGSPAAMLSSAKRRFDELLGESRKLHDRFAKKGMAMVPVPYAGELLLLLRQMPRRLTPAEMRAKLLAGIKCGDKLLDANTTWYSWMTSSDHVPLERAIDDARTAADIYGKSRRSSEQFAAGDPVYDEFLRRLTRIFIEAAGLYGMREVKETARSELRDDVRKIPKQAESTTLWLVALAGAAYLGISWLARPRAAAASPVVVAVPDAVPTDVGAEHQGGEP